MISLVPVFFVFFQHVYKCKQMLTVINLTHDQGKGNFIGCLPKSLDQPCSFVYGVEVIQRWSGDYDHASIAQ
jgi:hypothetical protein